MSKLPFIISSVFITYICLTFSLCFYLLFFFDIWLPSFPPQTEADPEQVSPIPPLSPSLFLTLEMSLRGIRNQEVCLSNTPTHSEYTHKQIWTVAFFTYLGRRGNFTIKILFDKSLSLGKPFVSFNHINPPSSQKESEIYNCSSI